MMNLWNSTSRPRRNVHQVVICAAVLWACFLPKVSAQNSPKPGGIKGQFAVPIVGKQVLIPRETRIWIIYGPEFLNYSSYGSSNNMGRYAYAPSIIFKNGQDKCNQTYMDDLKKVTKEMKAVPKGTTPDPDLMKRARTLITGGNLSEIQCTDAALAGLTDWVAKYPKNSWEVKLLTTDENGVWSVDDLAEGAWVIIARSHFSGKEALWECSVDVKPGATGTIPPFEPTIAFDPQ